MALTFGIISDVDSKLSEAGVLVAVGSGRERICSIGAFARAEAEALRAVAREVRLLEPDARERYPITRGLAPPDVIFFHAPSLHDRKRPWNALVSAFRLRAAFPGSIFVPVVHEFCEAPLHWKARQIALLRMGHGAIVNCQGDFEGLKGWSPNILYTSLGPTLFYPELLDAPASKGSFLEALRAGEKKRMGAELRHREADRGKWVVYPGLLTPGKGVERLSRFERVLGERDRLIVMGGQGPKERDRQYAMEVLARLRSRLGSRLVWLDSPGDSTFRGMLLAANLVVLPFEKGVSERRSSFLATMSCGGNVWTTSGERSSPLDLSKTGAYLTPEEIWNRGSEDEALGSIRAALNETDETSISRRLKNLAWASERTWEKRAARMAEFIPSLRRS